MLNIAKRQEERDRMKSLSVEIDNLYYSTIEQQICSFFDMGETNTNMKKQNVRRIVMADVRSMALKKWVSFPSIS